MKIMAFKRQTLTKELSPAAAAPPWCWRWCSGVPAALFALSRKNKKLPFHLIHFKEYFSKIKSQTLLLRCRLSGGLGGPPRRLPHAAPGSLLLLLLAFFKQLRIPIKRRSFLFIYSFYLAAVPEAEAPETPQLAVASYS